MSEQSEDGAADGPRVAEGADRSETDALTILVTGATGRLGQHLRPALREAGHDLRLASRSPPADDPAASERDVPDEAWVELDLATGDGLERAVDGADAIVHAASAPTGDSEAVDVEGTRRLADAAADAGVEYLLYVSIVGIDAIPWSYYEHKLAAEELLLDHEVPATVLRATQFHEFAADVLDSLARLPVWPLPTRVRIQPIAAAEVADAIVERVAEEPAGRLPPMGGPEVLTLREIAETYREVRGLRRWILPVPLPGSVAGAFRTGEATCPDRAVGEESWAEWLTERERE